MVDVSKVSQLNAQYDNKTVKIEDNKGQVHEVKLSIFQEGMAVTNDTKDVTAVFNANKSEFFLDNKRAFNAYPCFR